ncbi:MAG: response regulator [Spirochaetales bacterium]|nr:response regulator [Spirochaetales bacterium]
MKTEARSLWVFFFPRGLEFRARLFNVLAAAGTLISICAAFMNWFIRAGIWDVMASGFCVLLALALLIYSNRTGRYRLCYIITVTVVFLVLFPFFFFSAGGYHSGMPSFFVFALVFTVFMLEGKTALVMTGLEAVVYTGICLYAWKKPGAVDFFVAEGALVSDVIFCFMAAGMALGVTMFIQLRMYRQRQRELEEARTEALRLSRVKSSFLANMSHEIRTPVNVILGMNEMVLRERELLPGDGGDQIANYALSIQIAGKTLLELINNILDIAKIESGKTEVLEEEYSMEDLIRELSLIGSERAGKKGLRFVCEADTALPGKLYGDFIHLKQVAHNFLSNAVKYTERGSVILRISGCREGMGGGDETGEPSPRAFLLRIAVEDTGVGIKEEHRGMLFEAFTRIDACAHRSIEGTGLGLAIAGELAQLMGGRITVESAWGKGSVFTLEVPQGIPRGESLGGDYAGPAGSAGRGKREGSSFTAPGGRVLVVDDSWENLQVLSFLLCRTLLAVDTVSSGFECLEAVKKKNYHVILMDYRMPGMNGIETFRRLREGNRNFSVPVIALTADALRETERHFLEEGFSACLTKPIMWRELEERLCGLLPAELVVTAGFEEAPDSAPDWKADFPAKEKQERRAMMEDVREGLPGNLAAWGVLPEEGLRYLSPETGLSQYKKLAGFFTENYQAARQETAGFVARKNWEGLSFSVHSLKSTAGAVGALDLQATAARMEKYCMAKDGDYIETAMPLLLLEWERACRGLEGFIRGMNETGGAGKAVPRREAREASTVSGGDGMETLLRYIRGNRFSEAEETLNRLLASVSSGAERRKLMAVQEKIKALDFEQAERLLVGE